MSRASMDDIVNVATQIYWTLLSCDTVYCTVQDVPKSWVTRSMKFDNLSIRYWALYEKVLAFESVDEILKCVIKSCSVLSPSAVL